jgi:uncharacterized membrane protein YdjX (TVP38/TMEM64 family)
VRLRREAGWLATTAFALALMIAAVEGAPFLLRTLRSARTFGAGAPLAFVLIHAAGVMAFVPATVFAFAGGALFGSGKGAAYSILGGGIGALGAFLVGRHLVRHLLAGRFVGLPQLVAVDRAVAANGIRILVLLRLSPIMPFNLLNYVLGVSTVRLRDFVLGFVGMLPGTILAAYAGQLAGEALALAGETEPAWTASYYAALIIGLAATLAAAAVIARTASRALRNMA